MVAPTAVTDIKEDPAMLLFEGGDQLAQETSGERGDDADSDRAGFDSPGRARIVQGHLDRLDGRDNLAEKPFSCHGQQNPARCALKQGDTDIVFEFTNPAADSRHLGF